MDEIKAKQQVVEKIKEASKILVTVSDDPSVDSLSAALALTLILDKQEKYATSIFSGETPPAIAFLEPEKTFDDTTDSLRDFIIALNKEKADHLRYKIEGDSVKIFITPYKTTIDQQDLEFSQGDYNVELVIALGVSDQDHLDKALENHGQILHDAAIITFTAGDQTSSLGGVDWHDANASGISEMVAGLAEALKEDKKKTLIDAPIATALLTGIVAQTDRFSNEHTSSKVMTVAASLMVAGADQQLIANEIQQARSIEVANAYDEPEEDSDDTDIPKSDDTTPEETTSDTAPEDPTRLSIEHEDETLADLDERVRGEEASQEKIQDELEAMKEEAKQHAQEREEDIFNTATGRAEATEAPEEQSDHDLLPTEPFQNQPDEKAQDEPMFGGALSATADQAAEDARRALEEDQNKAILDHAPIGEPAPAPSGPISEERVIQPISEEPIEPASTPAYYGLPLPPPVPDFSQGLAAVVPPTIPQPELVQTPEQPQILGDILTSDTSTTDTPPAMGLDYEATNTVAAPGSAYALDDAPVLPTPEAPQAPQPAPFPQQPSAPVTPPPANNPGQFQIPGQPQ